MKPLVSIVIPVYNSGAYLPETIASVNKQTYENIELIIVDNSSDDEHTIAYLKEIQEKYKVLYTGRTGVAAARNVAIKKAKGEYILALDSDDIIKPPFVEKCIEQMQKDSTVSVVRTQVELFGKKSGTIKFPSYDFSVLLARNLMVVTSLFKREDWERIGGFDADFILGFEDWEYWINLLKDGGKVATIEEPLFRYRIRKESRNSSLKQKDFKLLRRQIWGKHKDLYATYFVDPTESFEYKFIEESTANKVGNLLMKPFMSLKLMK